MTTSRTEERAHSQEKAFLEADPPAINHAEAAAIPYRIVGVGASAGDPEAMAPTVKRLRSGSGMACVPNPHLDAKQYHRAFLSKAIRIPILEREGVAQWR